MGFPRQKHWSGLPFFSPRHLPDPGIVPVSPAFAGRFFTTEPPGKPSIIQTLQLRLTAKSVQSLSHVQLFATPWTAACQAFLSVTHSWSLLKLMSIESVMPSNHVILCHPLLLLQSFPTSGSSPMSQFFSSDGQNMGAAAAASVHPTNILGWFPLGSTLFIYC